MKIQAVNQVVILRKDTSYLKSDPNLISEQNYKSKNMTEIPEPYTGTIDSVGFECGYEIGDRVAFCDMGGVYVEMGEKEYVVLTPDMIIGKFE